MFMIPDGSPIAEAMTARGASHALWLELELGEGEVFRAANRPLTVDGEPWPAVMVQADGWTLRSALPLDPGTAPPPALEGFGPLVASPLGGFRGRVELLNLPRATQASIEAALHTRQPGMPPTPTPVLGRLGLCWRRGPLAQATATDMLTLARVALVQFHTSGPGRLTLTMEDYLTVALEASATRPFEPALPAHHPFSFRARAIMPLIFGAVEGVALMPWRFHAMGTLAEPLEPGATMARLRDASRFPDAGHVQIGREVLRYTAIQRHQGMLGAPGYPLERPQPTWHPAEAEVCVVPEGGFAWLVADHPVEAVTNVRPSDGSPPPDTPAVRTELPLRGRRITVVTLPRLPLGGAEVVSRFDVRLTAREGIHWRPGPHNVVANPMSVLDADNYNSRVTFDDVTRVLQIEADAQPGLADRFGRVLRATVLVRYAAPHPWNANSRLRITIQSGGRAYHADVPRPDFGGAIHDGSARLDFTERVGDDAAHFTQPFSLMITWMPYLGDATEIHVFGCLWELHVENRAPRKLVTALLADVRGWNPEAATGQPLALRHPARLLRRMLHDPTMVGLEGGSVDNTSFAGEEAAEATAQPEVSRVVREPTAWRPLVETLLDEAGLGLEPARDATALVRLPACPLMGTTRLLLEGETLQADAAARALATHPPGAPREVVLFGSTAQGVDRHAGMAVAASEGHTPGAGSPRATAARWLPGTARTLALALAHRRLAHRLDAHSPAVVPLTPSGLAHLSGSTLVAMAHPGMGGSMLLGRVVALGALEHPTSHRLLVRNHGEGRWLATAGNTRLTVWNGAHLGLMLGAQMLALFESTGRTLIAGRVIEFATMPEPADAPAGLAHRDGSTLLQATHNGAPVVLATLDPAGNLHLPGGLSLTSRALAVFGAPLSTGEGELAIVMPDGSTRLHAAVGQPLRLAGALIEQALAPVE